MGASASQLAGWAQWPSVHTKSPAQNGTPVPERQHSAPTSTQEPSNCWPSLLAAACSDCESCGALALTTGSGGCSCCRFACWSPCHWPSSNSASAGTPRSPVQDPSSVCGALLDGAGLSGGGMSWTAVSWPSPFTIVPAALSSSSRSAGESVISFFHSSVSSSAVGAMRAELLSGRCRAAAATETRSVRDVRMASTGPEEGNNMRPS